MSGVNKAIIIGRLGADPEIKQTKGGMSVCNLSIATSDEWKDESGEKKSKTEWHRVVAFGKLADLAGQYLAKGREVYVDGKIQTRSWETDSGEKKYSTEILASQIQFLGGASGDKSDTSTATEPKAPASPTIDQNDGF